MAPAARISFAAFGVLAFAMVASGGCTLLLSRDGIAGAPLVDDAAPPGDAGAPDAGDAGDSGSDALTTTRFCAATSPMPLFCDDFDDRSAKSMWSGSFTTAGHWSIDDDVFASPPSSRLATTDPLAAGSSLQVALRKEWPELAGTAATWNVSFKVKLGDLDPNGAQTAVAKFVFGDVAVVRYELQLLASLDSAKGRAQIMFTEWSNEPDVVFLAQHAIVRRVDPAAWTSVRLTVDVRSASEDGQNSAAVFFDGMMQLTTDIALKVPGGAPTLLLGPSWSTSPSAPLAIHYDDVLVTRQPR